jgi:ATP-dependent RNA helicase DDX27
MSDYVMTIGSDVEDFAPTTGFRQDEDVKLDPDFVFDVSGDPYVDFSTKGIGVQDLVMTGTKPVRLSSQNLNHVYNWFNFLATNIS